MLWTEKNSTQKFFQQIHMFSDSLDHDTNINISSNFGLQNLLKISKQKRKIKIKAT